jgi:hypothetical protein
MAITSRDAMANRDLEPPDEEDEEDVLITGNAVVIGVAAVAAGIYAAIRGWESGDLRETYTPAVSAAKAGFKSAMAGKPAPTEGFTKAGWDQGKANFDALLAKAKQDNARASDAAIKAAIAAKADEALNKVAEQIGQAIRSAIWDGYLARHRTMLVGNDARWAYVACFGEEPDLQNPDQYWKDYMMQHPLPPKTSAT